MSNARDVKNAGVDYETLSTGSPISIRRLVLKVGSSPIGVYERIIASGPIKSKAPANATRSSSGAAEITFSLRAFR